MFHNLNSLVGTALMERLTLVVNHVLGSEPVAMERLRPHAGRCIQLQFSGWPSLLPPALTGVFCVTPAGLVEWCAEAAAPPALRVTIDASNPARGLLDALTGRRPKVEVAGDAAFASDLNWLIDNLRWDVEDDLARIVGEAPAHEIARLARGVAAGVRRAARALGGRARRASADDPQFR